MNEQIQSPAGIIASLEKRLAEMEAEKVSLVAENISLRQLYERAPLAYQSLDSTGCFIEVNQTWLVTLGYTREEVIGKNFGEFLHPDWKDHFKENLPRFKAIGEILGIEFEMVKKDGSTILISFYGKISKDTEGHFQQTHCIFQDITERKNAENTLRLRESCLSAIINNQPGLLWLKDRHNKFLAVNTEFSKSCGLNNPELLVGKTDLEIWPKELADKYIEDDAEVLRSGKPLVVEEVISVNGETKWFETFKAPVFDSQEIVIGTTGYSRDITERKRAEEALRESEKQYRSIVEQAAEGIVLVDTETYRFVDFNDATCSGLGYSREEFTNLSLIDVQGSLAKDDFIRCFNAVVESGGGVFENRQLRKDGTHRDTIISNQVINLKGRKYVSGIWRDITERKRAELALMESEERLQLVMEGSQLGYWDWNIEAGEVRRNKYWAEMLGYTLQEIELSIKQWTDLHHPDDREAAWKSINDHLEGKTPEHRIEYRMLAKDGQYRWILDQARIVRRNDQGKPTRMSGTHTDITERKRSEADRVQKEKELRKNKQFLRDLADGLPGLVGYWSRDSICLFANKKYLEWYGKSPEQAEGLFIEDVLGEEIYTGSKQYIDKALQGKQQSFEREMVKTNGDTVTAWVQYIPDIIQGETKGFFSFVSDITEIKKIQREKEQLSVHLQQAQKMEAIGTLAGGIAHDFNNILGAILGYAELVKDACPIDSEIAHDLDKVLAAGERAADLVKQILAFSRQSNADRLPLGPVNLVKETIKLLRPALPATIEIKQNLDIATRNILADPTQLHQVVMNLCTNAFHAMEDSGGTLEITLNDCALSSQDLKHQPTVTPGNFVQLSIKDTGPGIPKGIQDRIFEPYFTTKEVGKGTGLGLSIIHGIVASLGGFVACESEHGKGTVFKVYIPAIEAEVISAPKQDNLELSGKESILLIDDETLLAEMGKTMLERLGYRVTARSSSLEALATFQNQPQEFDAVVTDQTMPGMTGVDMARIMLQIRPDIPIILCTGYSSIINEEQAYRYGIKGFAMKPLSKKDLASTLRKVLDQGKNTL